MSKEGNEGNEIFFYSLRQSFASFYDYPVIPASIESVGSITADVLVEILIRALQIITGNKEDLPVKLPQNIAARHRICTFIATAIKENGFIGECGYNQLLYPLENNTRNILNWVVDKLPKPDEGQDEEVLGANALLNRRIKSTILQWSNPSPSTETGAGHSSNLWTAPFCLSSKDPHNNKRCFITVPVVNKNKNKNMSTAEMFKVCTSSQTVMGAAKINSELYCPSIGPSILEQHALDKVKDSAYALDLENFEGSGKKGNMQKIKNNKTNLDTALSIRRAVYGLDVEIDSNVDELFPMDVNSSSTHKAFMNGSLQELLGAVIGDCEASSSSLPASSDSSSSRFMHAMDFAQETNGSVFASSSSSSSSSFAGGSIATSGNAKDKDKDDPSARKQTQEQEAREYAAQLGQLRQQLDDSTAATESYQHRYQTATGKTHQLEKEALSLETNSEKLEKQIMIKKKTLEMLPTAEAHTKELQARVQASKEKLAELEAEWGSHRQPLEMSFREKEGFRIKRREQCRELVDEMRQYKVEMVEMAEMLQGQQEKARILEEELTRLPKNINRNMYTHRILDITQSILRQNEGIDKITADIMDVQKKINTTQSTLQRADTITEELVYRVAKDLDDQDVLGIYRHLKNLRSTFDALVQCLEKIALQEQHHRNLETKIDQEQSRVSTNNFNRIQEDLSAIVSENKQLITQIKAIK